MSHSDALFSKFSVSDPTYHTQHTDLVLIIDLFEVYLVELVVFIEHLPDVRLSDLLKVQVEGLAV